MNPSNNPLNLIVTPWGLWVTKLGLRSLSSMLSIIVIFLSVVLANIPGVLIATIPAACATICWNALSFIYLLRQRRSDTHPGLRVASDLVTWLGWGFVAVYMSSALSMAVSVTLPRYRNALPAIETMLVFAAFQAVLHVSLFIIACCETHVRNRTKRMMRRIDSKQQDMAV